MIDGDEPDEPKTGTMVADRPLDGRQSNYGSTNIVAAVS